MKEARCKILLDTADIRDDDFQRYLEGAEIATTIIPGPGPLTPVEYVGTRRALERMIGKWFSTNSPEEDRAMVDSIALVDALMSAEDRARFVELLQEESARAYEDGDDSLEVALEYELNGVRGLVDLSDEELLAEADSTYLEGAELANPPDGGYWDPTGDELFRLWAKCRMPGVLCPDCGGSGEVKVEVAFGCNLDDCPKCGGSGLQGQPLLPKYLVTRVRKVADHLEVQAASPQEAIEKATRSGAWTGQEDKDVRLSAHQE